MSWLWSPSSSSTKTGGAAKPSTDGGFIAPDRDQRAKCWEARDLYNTCLDRHDILDPIRNAGDSREKCGAEEQGFERDCAKSWVTYFKQKRLADWKKEQTIREIEQKGGEVLPRPQAR